MTAQNETRYSNQIISCVVNAPCSNFETRSFNFLQWNTELQQNRDLAIRLFIYVETRFLNRLYGQIVQFSLVTSLIDFWYFIVKVKIYALSSLRRFGSQAIWSSEHVFAQVPDPSTKFHSFLLLEYKKYCNYLILDFGG